MTFVFSSCDKRGGRDRIPLCILNGIRPAAAQTHRIQAGSSELRVASNHRAAVLIDSVLTWSKPITALRIRAGLCAVTAACVWR